MSRKILGLDIREESIAAVMLDSGFKGSTLENQVYLPIPEDHRNEEGLAEALHTVVEALKLSGAACVLGIPATFVSFRNISVPFHDLKKIRQVLPFELEPSLPLPVEELIFDFEAHKNNGHQDLLAFTVRKTQIQHYLDLLDTVNLNPVAIMPGGYAASKFISAMTADSGDFVLIDAGDGHHTVYASCSDQVRMARTLPIAGGGVPVIHHLETGLKHTFTAMRDHLGIDVDPATVFVAGPRAGSLKTVKEKSTLMDLPVKSIAEIRGFPKLKGAFDTPDWEAGHLDTALALALMETEAVSGVNFSTRRSTVQHYWSEYRSEIIFTAVLVLLTITAALAGQFLEVREKTRRLEELDRQIELVFKQTFPAVTKIHAPLQQMQIKLKEMGESGTGLDLPGSRVRVIDILDAISQKIPPSAEVKLSRMVLGTDNVVLSGNTDTFNTVDDMKSRLETSDLFKQVTISSADLDKSGQGVRFKLKLDY
jgi:type II secretion system protein L